VTNAGYTSVRRISAVSAVLAALGVLVAVVTTGGSTPIQGISATGGSTTTTTLVIDPPVLGTPRAFQTAAGQGLANGRTRIERSLGCASGGDADYWHFQSEAPLAAGVLTGPTSKVPGDLRLYADIHSPHHGIRATPEPPVEGPDLDSAFLLPDGSHVGLSNRRGTVKLRLRSGDCDNREGEGATLDFDGTTATLDHDDEPASWEIVSSTGSYRLAEGSGWFDLSANVSPGADNPWSLVLNGAIAVLQPRLEVEVADTFWGRDGVDYVRRHMGVVYDVTNVGSGDAYGVLLSSASSPTPGATLIAIIINGDNILIDGNTPVGSFPRSLGDLASGEHTQVTLKWQLPLPAGNPPCGLVILDCEIDTTLGFTLPDALDVATTPSFTLPAKAPHLPPPL
jgi:hypothetical protein